MTKILHIIRGLPGSGKTTLARSLTRHYFEADQYFETEDGYEFDAQELGDAHDYCKHRVKSAMIEGRTPIAVSNTFIRRGDYVPYTALAQRYGYQVQILSCEGDPNWASIHQVPDWILERMRARWEA